MIDSFADKETQKIWERKRSKKLPSDIQQIAYRKMQMLHAAQKLQDVRSPPANHLEALKGNRKGQHSIRINKQWRLCFVWNDGKVQQVEIVDYHS